ncbi:ABC transporter ATP-binding protein [Marinobacterium aestuariivivens]|uniref:ABC transporter ATP-binding protein n=1 Tax=Marinobacterium aestuariivivens TaxID=1698799 RepID=A0ABW2A8E7_9GAMM
MFEQLHLLSDELVATYFSHSHWWLHTTVHWILLGSPIMLTGLLALQLHKTLRFYLHKSQQLLPAKNIQRSKMHREISGTLYSYIVFNTGRQQVLLFLVALLSLPLLYITLEIPKHIVNHAIGTDDFPIDIVGIQLDQLEFLFGLCLLYLLAISLNGSLKYSVNLFKGILAESILRRLRVKVYSLWRKRQGESNQSQVIPVIVQELEAIAGFAGDIVVLPVFQGGTFLTILFFLFMQDPLLGAAAVSLLPVQLIVIPHLQKKVNYLGRLRMKEVRHLGRVIGDHTDQFPSKTVSAFASIRTLQSLRIQIYRRKFMMKGLYNFVTHMTPFFFYTIGGYLVIEEKLTFGALVAALAAHKDFSAPLKELFRYYQTLEDVRIRWNELAILLKRQPG